VIDAHVAPAAVARWHKRLNEFGGEAVQRQEPDANRPSTPGERQQKRRHREQRVDDGVGEFANSEIIGNVLFDGVPEEVWKPPVRHDEQVGVTGERDQPNGKRQSSDHCNLVSHSPPSRSVPSYGSLRTRHTKCYLIEVWCVPRSPPSGVCHVHHK
jgi:hypothetical protein